MHETTVTERNNQLKRNLTDPECYKFWYNVNQTAQEVASWSKEKLDTGRTLGSEGNTRKHPAEEAKNGKS
ncbi:MAG: hypothetical protein WCV79_04105 [Candidatus Paceibacterota bacterium]